MTSTTATYLSISNNLAAQQAATANSPQVKNDTAYYLANIGSVKSVSDLVNNYRLFTYVMKANGLEDMDYAKGLVTKIIEGGTSSTSALANQLDDPRYIAIANTFGYLAQGSSATTTPSTAVTTTTVNNYVEQSLEDNVGTTNQGAQLALYFQRNASSVTNLYGLLADKNLLQVVQTAFGLPSSASENIDSEEKTLSNYVSLSDLQNPAKVKQIAERFTAMWDVEGNNTSSDVSNIAQIFSKSTTLGISSDLLLSLQGLRLGGS